MIDDADIERCTTLIVKSSVAELVSLGATVATTRAALARIGGAAPIDTLHTTQEALGELLAEVLFHAIDGVTDPAVATLWEAPAFTAMRERFKRLVEAPPPDACRGGIAQRLRAPLEVCASFFEPR